MKVTIVPFHQSRWAAVAEIYAEGLKTGNATFETTVPDFETWDRKFLSQLRWIALVRDEVIGWAGLTPVSTRPAYDGVAEVSLYVSVSHQGKGFGKLLMDHLISESEKAGIWTLFASVFPENDVSIRLHEKAGFRKIGYRERIGKLNGIWRNTLIYERRSKITGNQ
jgi:L-amino acid N-acyltransferase YncA